MYKLPRILSSSKSKVKLFYFKFTLIYYNYSVTISYFSKVNNVNWHEKQVNQTRKRVVRDLRTLTIIKALRKLVILKSGVYNKYATGKE